MKVNPSKGVNDLHFAQCALLFFYIISMPIIDSVILLMTIVEILLSLIKTYI